MHRLPVDAKSVVLYVFNVLSIIAALSVLVSYAMFRRRYPIAMSRATLVISVCMSVSNLFFHTFNIGGYTKLGPAACSVIGGFFFSAPLLCTLFYACSVSLNCLCVFIFRLQQRAWLKWLYLVAPPVASVLISLGTLASGSYGYDADNDSCWFKTEGVSPRLLNARQILTYGVPMLFCMLFLLVSVPVIIMYLHRPFYRRRGTSLSGPSSHRSTASRDNETARTLARRALLFRLLAYMAIPLITCFYMVVTQGLAFMKASVSYPVEVMGVGLCSLLGTLNAIVYFVDPTVLVILGVLRRGQPKPVDGIDTVATATDFEASYTSKSRDEYSLDLYEKARSPHQSGGVMVMVEITKAVDEVDEVARKIKDL